MLLRLVDVDSLLLVFFLRPTRGQATPRLLHRTQRGSAQRGVKRFGTWESKMENNLFNVEGFHSMYLLHILAIKGI